MTPAVMSRLPERIGAAFGRLGFGTAQFGNLGCEIDERTCHDAVAAAWEHGLRYFDTAPHYGLGLSERRLGRALTGRPRESYAVSTKVGRLLRPNTRPTGTDLDQGYAVPDSLTRERDFSADGVRRCLAESLERLGLDRVDIVWLHDPEEPDDRFDEAIRGAVPALDQLRDEGTISAWGVGSKDPSMIKRFVDAADPDLVMVAGRYTLLEQERVGLMSTCHARGVGVVAVGVFNSGLLAHDEPPADAWYEYAPAPPHVTARARALASVAREHGVSLPRAALAFPRRHPAVVNVTAGMRSREHVAQNCALVTNDVPDEFWADLRARGLLEEDV
ncbi:aldo/keto reductase [Halostreptopolyspora alba]|uniref:Aldo/keto reductase n=1 Tax=Halostreptopolyspora alba TaxID=2487137 RepID=A0A3N0EC39_9ACTN|nr:aldo/keto reductase [Nocardiopsaceae bacterium YIM 96095]